MTTPSAPIKGVPRDCPPRFATARTPERPTLGGAAARIAIALGTPFMPWQQQVMDIALELDPATRRLVYREVILTVPRQSGKTTSLLSLILSRALSRPMQKILYTAQTRADARKKWSEDWLPELEKSEFAKHFRTRLSNGDESLLFANGSRQGLLASTERSGHGGTIDLAIIDEAFAQKDARAEQATKPAMITRPDPQLWIVSTAGTKAASPYLWAKVETGRELVQAGLNDSVAYFEWSADEDADPADPETWYQAMPALGRTVTEDAVLADFRSMELHEFKRAYLNQWTKAMTDPVIPYEKWLEAENPNSEMSDPIVLAIDATPDRSHATIAAAGRSVADSDVIQVEVIEHRRGVKWVVPRIKDLCRKHKVTCVVWDPSSPVGSLSSEIAGELPVDDVPVNGKELTQACGGFFDAATEDDVPRIVHLGGTHLNAALGGAIKQPSGDAWKWNRKGSSVVISPLVAATLAHWGVMTHNTAPEVWDLNEIIERMRRERAAAAADEDLDPRSDSRVELEQSATTSQRFTPAVDATPGQRFIPL